MVLVTELNNRSLCFNDATLVTIYLVIKFLNVVFNVRKYTVLFVIDSGAE